MSDEVKFPSGWIVWITVGLLCCGSVEQPEQNKFQEVRRSDDAPGSAFANSLAAPGGIETSLPWLAASPPAARQFLVNNSSKFVTGQSPVNNLLKRAASYRHYQELVQNERISRYIKNSALRQHVETEFARGSSASKPTNASLQLAGSSRDTFSKPITDDKQRRQQSTSDSDYFDRNVADVPVVDSSRSENTFLSSLFQELAQENLVLVNAAAYRNQLGLMSNTERQQSKSRRIVRRDANPDLSDVTYSGDEANMSHLSDQLTPTAGSAVISSGLTLLSATGALVQSYESASNGAFVSAGESATGETLSLASNWTAAVSTHWDSGNATSSANSLPSTIRLSETDQSTSNSSSATFLSRPSSSALSTFASQTLSLNTNASSSSVQLTSVSSDVVPSSSSAISDVQAGNSSTTPLWMTNQSTIAQVLTLASLPFSTASSYDNVSNAANDQLSSSSLGVQLTTPVSNDNGVATQPASSVASVVSTVTASLSRTSSAPAAAYLITFKLNASYADVANQREIFVGQLGTSLASVMQVDQQQITNLNIFPGSIGVSFNLAVPAGSAPTSATNLLQAQLANGTLSVGPVPYPSVKGSLTVAQVVSTSSRPSTTSIRTSMSPAPVVKTGSSRTGIIVGCIVGVLVVVILLIIGVCLYRKYRKKKQLVIEGPAVVNRKPTKQTKMPNWMPHDTYEKRIVIPMLPVNDTKVANDDAPTPAIETLDSQRSTSSGHR